MANWDLETVFKNFVDDRLSVRPWLTLTENINKEIDDDTFSELVRLSKDKLGEEYGTIQREKDRFLYFDALERKYKENVSMVLENIFEHAQTHVSLGSVKISDKIKEYRRLEQRYNLRCSDGNFEEMRNQEVKNVLQQHLMHIYGKRRFWENPVSSEEVFLSQMYVQPSAKFVMEIDDQGMLTEVKEQASSKLSYAGIFKSKTGLCENIYITGDAGKGKTTFCNQLFLRWCDAVQNIPNETGSSDDLKILAPFRFLFHINLRYSEKTYHVEEMIKEQLLHNAPVSVNISDILKTEKCLIVLDGLDEWPCPKKVKKCPDINQDIPGRNISNKNTVFLTTSRSWKYDVIALKSADRDKHIELSGVGEESSKELASKILINLDRKSKSKKYPSDFYDKVKQKELGDFLTVPFLLIQLITLWHAGRDFGNSQLQLYCSMLDLMFERSEKNLPEEIPESSSTAGAISKPLPECFSDKDYCQKYAVLINCLAKLAYNKQKGNALTFKSSKLDIFGISDSNIKLCLQCGILSQCKDYGNYKGKYKKFSFLHTKVQECLAALYLVTYDKAEDFLKEVKQLCNSAETMLKMNQVWLFVAGMDRNITRRLTEYLGHIVSADERVKTYRQTVDRDRITQCLKHLGFIVSDHEQVNTYRWTVDRDYDSLIEAIQRFVSDCVSEGIRNDHHFLNVCLEDFYVDWHNDRDVERLLLCSDMSKVKSVYIWTEGISFQPMHLRTNCINAAKLAAITGQFLQCRSIQRLHLIDWYSLIPDSTVATLVDNNWASLTALYLYTKITTTDKLVIAICNSINKSLMALGLENVKLTHTQLKQILDSLSQSLVIRQIYVALVLDWEDHYEGKAQIDLSIMTQLRELTLIGDSMYIDNPQSLSNYRYLERVQLHYVKLTHAHLEQLLHSLSQSPVIRQLDLDLLHCTDHGTECRCRAKIDCSGMTRLQKLTLNWVESEIGSSLYVDNLHFLSQCVVLVELQSVTLPVTSLCDFARGLSKTKGKVPVKLLDITFTETREECGDLEGFLRNCPGMEFRKCEYFENAWTIY